MKWHYNIKRNMLIQLSLFTFYDLQMIVEEEQFKRMIFKNYYEFVLYILNDLL